MFAKKSCIFFQYGTVFSLVHVIIIIIFSISKETLFFRSNVTKLSRKDVTHVFDCFGFFLSYCYWLLLTDTADPSFINWRTYLITQTKQVWHLKGVENIHLPCPYDLMSNSLMNEWRRRVTIEWDSNLDHGFETEMGLRRAQLLHHELQLV